MLLRQLHGSCSFDEMKKCFDCKRVLEFSMFRTDRSKKDKLTSICRECGNARNVKLKRERKANRVCLSCPDEVSLKSSTYCTSCLDRVIKYNRDRLDSKLEKPCKRCGKPPLKSMTRCASCNDFERASARERYRRLNGAKRIYQRRKTDLQLRLRDVLRGRLNKALKGNYKAGSAVQLLGCSILEFKDYLERKFTLGMTWSRYGKGQNNWQIDHIKPLSLFNLSDEQELSKACHFTNMQPLWQQENISKGCKYDTAKSQ